MTSPHTPDRPSPARTDAPIEPGSVVTLRYAMWNHADGEKLDECDADDALVYLHGADNVPPGLERGLAGRRAGEKVELVLPPADAFGDPDPDAVQVVPRDEFPADAELVPGMAFGAFADEDETEEVVIFVLNVSDDEVTVTANHPLAGLTLRYEVEVLAVRDARPEELEHGHPHEDGEDCE
jgi:FKBP-type peptidyl-prolyl cis-trans isomerase SlyD